MRQCVSQVHFNTRYHPAKVQQWWILSTHRRGYTRPIMSLDGAVRKKRVSSFILFKRENAQTWTVPGGVKPEAFARRMWSEADESTKLAYKERAREENATVSAPAQADGSSGESPSAAPSSRVRSSARRRTTRGRPSTYSTPISRTAPLEPDVTRHTVTEPRARVRRRQGSRAGQLTGGTQTSPSAETWYQIDEGRVDNVHGRDMFRMHAFRMLARHGSRPFKSAWMVCGTY